MQRFNKHIAAFLLLISSLFIVPKELWHELTFHEDTIDHVCTTNTNDFAVGTQHHHCDILDNFVPPFQSSGDAFQISETIKTFSHSPFSANIFSFNLIDFYVIRGPPATFLYC